MSFTLMSIRSLCLLSSVSFYFTLVIIFAAKSNTFFDWMWNIFCVCFFCIYFQIEMTIDEKVLSTDFSQTGKSHTSQTHIKSFRWNIQNRIKKIIFKWVLHKWMWKIPDASRMEWNGMVGIGWINGNCIVCRSQKSKPPQMYPAGVCVWSLKICVYGVRKMLTNNGRNFGIWSMYEGIFVWRKHFNEICYNIESERMTASQRGNARLIFAMHAYIVVVNQNAHTSTLMIIAHSGAWKMFASNDLILSTFGWIYISVFFFESQLHGCIKVIEMVVR